MDQIGYWVALNRVPRLGTVRFSRLEAFFGPLENAWKAGLNDLKSAGIEARTAGEIIAARNRISPEEELERLQKAGVTAVNWLHKDYPARLKEISNPPPVLYYKGTLLPTDERSVAVVGTRSPTTYGKEVTANLTADLARCGLTIVSGMALGIDGVAHHTALNQGARTIAILASGLDIIYPRDHTKLFHQIQESGCVMSEIPLGVRPDTRSFPRRNRLISGVSLGTLVVEAGEKSGAGWTVRHALEQDREVFCVPGSIYSPASRLTNRLIQEGAKLVLNHNDILEELNLNSVARQIQMRMDPAPTEAPAAPAVPANLDEAETGLLSFLELEPLHIDEIKRRAGLPITQVSGTLTMLEIKGLVQQVGCMHYVMKQEAAPLYGN